MVKQERAARTREALIRSAAEVFGREGLSAASVTAISFLAGVSNGALHFHFATKAALADAVEGAALVRLRALTEGAPAAGTGRVQLLVDATHRLAAALRADVVLRAGFELNGEVSRVPRADLRASWQEWVARTVEEADTGGELSPGVAAGDVTAAVVAATVGLEVLGVRDALWLSRPTVVRFWRLLLPTLVPAALLVNIDPQGTGPR